MKRIKAATTMALAGVLMGACALIPPIPIGPGALGFTEQELIVPLAGSEGSVSASRAFSDIEQPSFPIGPRSFRSLMGFKEGGSVQVALGSPPDVVNLTSGTLSLVVEDQSGTPEPVTVRVDFGPLELRKDPACSASRCDYAFSDPDAAARALTFSIRGEAFRRLLQIITEGDEQNSVDVTLSLNTDVAAASVTLTIRVIQNYIDF